MKRKCKDTILIMLAYMAAGIWLISACLADSSGLLGNVSIIGTTMSGLWLGIFSYANNWWEN